MFLDIMMAVLAVALIIAIISFWAYDRTYLVILRKTRLTKLIARVEEGDEKALKHLLHMSILEHYPLYGYERREKNYVYVFAQWLNANNRRQDVAQRAERLGKDLLMLRAESDRQIRQRVNEAEANRLRVELREKQARVTQANSIPKKIEAQLWLISFWRQTDRQVSPGLQLLRREEGYDDAQLVAELTAWWADYSQRDILLNGDPSAGGAAAFKEVRQAWASISTTARVVGLSFSLPPNWGKTAAIYLANPSTVDLNLHPDPAPGSVRLLAAQLLADPKPSLYEAKRVLAYVNASEKCRAEVGEMAGRIARIVVDGNTENQAKISPKTK